MIPILGEHRCCPWCDAWTTGDGPCMHCKQPKLDTENMVKCPWDAQRGTKKGCLACKGSGWVEELK